MPIKINSTGGGSVSIDVPSTGGTYTLTAPANNATIFTTAGGAITGNVAFTSNNVTIGGQTIAPSYGMKNRIINGAMEIDQRNAGAAITTNASSFVVDRFYAVSSIDGTITAQQSTNAPAGFQNSIKMTTTVADASMGSGQYVQVAHGIEGYNMADLKWGTSDAKPITMSFWVYSSLTGTHSGAIRNHNTQRTLVYTYDISSANTWEYKTVTVPGDTGGDWRANTQAGAYIHFAGGYHASKQTATIGSWLTGDYYGANGAVQFVNTAGATWHLTGFQVESGTVATPFERRPFGTELALCQRYYCQQKGSGDSFATALPTSYEYSRAYCMNACQFPVVMRVTPTVTLYSGQTSTINKISGYSSGLEYTVSSISAGDSKRIGTYIQTTSSMNGLEMQLFYYTASAEL